MTTFDPPGVGWFALPGQKGFRQFQDQVAGLQLLPQYAPGARVLDLGCAEGLIGFWLMEHGAQHLDGVEIVESRVLTARRLATKRAPGKVARFHKQWLDDLAVRPPGWLLPEYDIALFLSIAQKLPDPAGVIAFVAERTRRAVAVRQPDPVIADRRSQFRPCDVPALLAGKGFRLLSERRVPNDRGEQEEWVGVFGRD